MTAEILSLHTEDGFSQFWSKYPRRLARKAAERAYQKAITVSPHHEIMAGLERYKASKPDYQDWAHAASWLNGERWTDDWGSDTGRFDHV